jgi:hypothetical protein
MVRREAKPYHIRSFGTVKRRRIGRSQNRSLGSTALYVLIGGKWLNERCAIQLMATRRFHKIPLCNSRALRPNHLLHPPISGFHIR